MVFLVVTEFTATGQGRFGSIQTYTVPATGCYKIVAGGARGGKHVTDYGDYSGYTLYFANISAYLIFNYISIYFQYCQN